MLRLKLLLENWPVRTMVLLVFSSVVMAAFYTLEFTDWADEVNRLAQGTQAAADGESRSPPPILLFVLPFVKQAVFIIVPASITVGILALLRRRRTKHQ